MDNKEQNRYQKKIFTIPNILTFVRFILIFVFVWLYSFERNYVAATVILIASSATDIVDGFIARRFNMISDLGKAIDPMADKLTQLSVLICLAFRFRLMLVPVILLIVKEVSAGIMVIIRTKRTHVVPSAVWHGKVNTALLYTTMILHVLWWDIPSVVSTVSIIICTAMMIVSGVLYAILNGKAIKKSNKNK